MRTKTGLIMTAAACAGVSACWLLLPDAATESTVTTAKPTVPQAVARLVAPQAAEQNIGPAKQLIAGNPWDDQASSAAAAGGQQSVDHMEQAVLARVAHLRAPSASATPTGEVANLERMSPRVAAMAQSGSDSMVELIVRHTGNPASTEATRVAQLGGQVLRQYENFPLMAVSIPANQIGEFAGGSSVDFLDLNNSIQAASLSARQAGNTPVSGSGSSVPVSTNFAVAVVDSGVANHTDLNVVSHRSFNDARTSLTTTYYDAFGKNTYAGSDIWSGSEWIERNDTGGSSSGYVRLTNSSCPADYNGYCLELRANGPSNVSVERSMELMGAKEALMFFDYGVANVSSTAEFVIEASADGVTWSQPLAR
ncbi:MAG: hypothetical protein IPG25_00720 [Proteobacteria bacterium]|nr:hypothetical protein [Pseudomonadota bacterium]